jgi:hypothetical protein
MKPTFFKGALVGGIAGAVMAAGTVALAGNGINGIFNLGVENAVDAQSVLKGTTASAQLKVNNQQGGDAAIAVQGLHSSGSGKGAGVQGETASTAAGANGVSGSASSASAKGDSNGVRGVNNGAGRGVYGQSSSGTGVYGNSKSQYGVWGIGSYGVVAGGSQGGVWASTDNGPGSGVYGQNTNTNGGRGVFGKGGTGVYGEGTGYGGQFISTNQNGGAGLWGQVPSGPGDGVHGEASGGTGVSGIGKSGGAFQGAATGVGATGYVFGAGTGVVGEAGVGGVGVKGIAKNGTVAVGYAGQFQGEVDVQGYLKLKLTTSEPPEGDCAYSFHRGRAVLYTDGTYLYIALCGPDGWKYRVVG